jgi:hypothetical protein
MHGSVLYHPRIFICSTRWPSAKRWRTIWPFSTSLKACRGMHVTEKDDRQCVSESPPKHAGSVVHTIERCFHAWNRELQFLGLAPPLGLHIDGPNEQSPRWLLHLRGPRNHSFDIRVTAEAVMLWQRTPVARLLQRWLLEDTVNTEANLLASRIIRALFSAVRESESPLSPVSG